MKIVKDYTKRGQRTPPPTVVPSAAIDDAKMSANNGGNQGNIESMIAHEAAMNQRRHRAYVPNAKLNRK